MDNEMSTCPECGIYYETALYTGCPDCGGRLRKSELRGEKLAGYLTVQEAAERLGLARQRVLYLIGRGRFDPVNFISDLYLIPETSIKEFEEKRKKQRGGYIYGTDL